MSMDWAEAIAARADVAERRQARRDRMRENASQQDRVEALTEHFEEEGNPTPLLAALMADVFG